MWQLFNVSLFIHSERYKRKYHGPPSIKQDLCLWEVDFYTKEMSCESAQALTEYFGCQSDFSVPVDR